MPLSSLLPRKAAKAPGPTSVGDDTGPVHDARVRAWRRLIGAVVLLALGLVLFPWLFESKPRPLPMDIPIEATRRDGGMVATAPAPTATRAVTPAPPPDAGNEAAAATSTPIETVPAKTDATSATSATSAAVMPTPVPATVPATAVVPAASSASGRFVVQVGAFTDATAVREARGKVEKLGFKTYTQVIETPTGRRTRVRVGPFETRDEADRASVRLKATGLAAYILLL